MKVYLDTCVWARPFDDQSQKRIAEETEAFFEIAWLIDQKEIKIIGSEVLIAECEDIDDESRRQRVKVLIFQSISRIIPLDEKILNYAKNLSKKCNTSGAGSLHIVSAKLGESEYFITTDDELLRKTDCIERESNKYNESNFLYKESLCQQARALRTNA